MAEPIPEEAGMPAPERGLAEHLALLRAEPPRPGSGLAARIVRRAGGAPPRTPPQGPRRPPALRSPLRTVGMLAAALADGVRLLTGARTRRS